MKREGLVFYRSWAESIKELPESEQLGALWAVIDYGLDGLEPSDGIARAIWLMTKPLIDNNNRRYENGKKGGRPRKTEPDENQTETETKPRRNQTKAKPREMLDELLVGRAVGQKVREALVEWVDYKAKEKGQTYKELGLRALITQAVNYSATYGAEAVCRVIRESMANQYKGIVWDRLEKKRPAAKFNNHDQRERDMNDLEIKLLATN